MPLVDDGEWELLQHFYVRLTHVVQPWERLGSLDTAPRCTSSIKSHVYKLQMAKVSL